MALWSSRFSKSITADTLAYTQTTDIDARMLRHDLWGSLAHILMLSACDIVSEAHARPIAGQLLRLIEEADRGGLVLDPTLEDVHLNIEDRIIKELGLDIGGRLHTARSRNDQVVADSRLYVRETLIRLGQGLGELIKVLLERAEQEADTLTLGYTHSQAAQPITFGFWLSGHASALLRDISRIFNALETLNANPLGSCALAGTSFSIDRTITTRLLGFDAVLVHALDATSARDYMAEAAAVCAILMAQLSRLAEEIVVWSSFDTGVIEVDDAYTTGSSIMPQKKNPVVAELVRARAATTFGCLMEILGLIKSVSMGYSCDLQQDKPPLWRAFDTAQGTVAIFTEQMRTLRFHAKRAEEKCWLSFATATELANHLVTAHGRPFRDAYRIVGGIVRRLEESQASLRDTDLVQKLLAEHDLTLGDDEIMRCVHPRAVVERQTSQGGTSPIAVRSTIAHLRSALGPALTSIDSVAAHVDRASTRSHQIARAFVAGDLRGSSILAAVLDDRQVESHEA
jgi:argininosuccinate lyase